MVRVFTCSRSHQVFVFPGAVVPRSTGGVMLTEGALVGDGIVPVPGGVTVEAHGCYVSAGSRYWLKDYIPAGSCC